MSIAHLPQPGRHFVGRDKKLALLDGAWPDDRANVVEFVAFGGVGKSALVAHWLIQMGRENWRGALRVLGHSFYSQGSREDAQASADAFIAEALEFFGDDDPTAGSPWEKGERLARHVRSAPTLLILDGVEPLQYPPTSGDAGRIRDPGLAALVRELAVKNNGLCVITTRHSIEDITWLEDNSVTKVDLEYLAKEAGAELLEQLGVKGSRAQLEQASTEVKGHGLALTLMGNYLRKACRGDVERRGEIGLLEADDEQGSHARRVIERYELWLSGKLAGEADVTESGRAALEVLRLMGLFDRPVTAGEFAALCADDPMPGLTDALAGVTDRRLELAVSVLEECGLITRPSSHPITLRASEPKATVLDAHPLVREHFAEQLAAAHEEATREAHRRLYEHLKQSVTELPDTLTDMMPLYHAVAHGCRAGLHKRAYETVYRPRICRENEYFQLGRLGASGTDLAMLSGFFQSVWDQPVGKLTDKDKSIILHTVGFELRAIGRLTEATQPMSGALEFHIEHSDWDNACSQAGNLSELYLTLGDVSAAVRAAEHSVELADRSGDAFARMGYRTTLADALQQAAPPGSDQYTEPLAAFREAEAIQADEQPEYPLLYSFQGFRYRDVLLGQSSAVSNQLSAGVAGEAVEEAAREAALVRIRQVRRRAETTLEWENGMPGAPILDFALHHLTLGWTWLLEALLVASVVPTETTDDEIVGSAVRTETTVTDDQSEEKVRTADPTHSSDLLANAERHLNDSVSLLRQAGQQQYLPRGLLARAALSRVKAGLDAAAASSSRAEAPRLVKPTVLPEEALAEAEKDLREVESIAQRGSMLIHQIDAAIERCRFHMAAASLRETTPDDAEPDAYTPARESLDRAKQLIERTDKPYEPHVPDWSDWQPPEYVGVFKKGDIVGYHRRDPEIAQLEKALVFHHA